MSDFYRTLTAPCGPYEMRERSSRFIAYGTPATTLEEVDAFIDSLRRQFHDATHIGWACRLGEGEEQISRSHDGGEPSGTAGIPIHREIVHADLFNVTCAVVRYFGGIKLGTGGLARAFGGAARGLLSHAPIRTVPITNIVRMQVPFESMGMVMHLIEHYPYTAVVSREYTEHDLHLAVAVPRSQVTAFQRDLIDKSRGRIIIIC